MGRTRICKMDIAKLGQKYAEMLLHDAQATPADIPDLTNRMAWRESCEFKRQEIERDIKEVAKGLLLTSGYSRELVRRVIGY